MEASITCDKPRRKLKHSCSFPLNIKLKITVKYQEAFGEEFVPHVFGFLNLVMVQSPCEMMDMRSKVAREQRVVIPKSSKSKGSDIAHKTDKKEAGEKSPPLMTGQRENQ